MSFLADICFQILYAHIRAFRIGVAPAIQICESPSRAVTFACQFRQHDYTRSSSYIHVHVYPPPPKKSLSLRVVNNQVRTTFSIHCFIIPHIQIKIHVLYCYRLPYCDHNTESPFLHLKVINAMSCLCFNRHNSQFTNPLCLGGVIRKANERVKLDVLFLDVLTLIQRSQKRSTTIMELDIMTLC